MATFKRFQVKSNGMAEYRQEGNTATVRFGKTFWKQGTEPPAELTITLPDGTSIQDLVGVREKKTSGLTEEEKAARAKEKEEAKAKKDAERAEAREARKKERDEERAKRDAERTAAREARAKEREAARAERENAEGAPAAAAEM